MTEQTQPTDEVLFNALKNLIVEAQAFSDDHHRPRYARLDQALASARNALLGYWATPQTTQAQAGAVPPIEWPKARDVGRIGDMSPSAHIRVGFDSDNDVLVSVWDEHGGGSIEFCNPGGGGGGQSSRTRVALIALMVAMEADNSEKPSRDWWALRMGGITKEGGQHGTDT